MHVQSFIVIFGRIAVVFNNLQRLSVELCECVVVINNCRWNCGSV